MEKTSKIGIAGGGMEGMAAARYLSEHGFSDVTIYDEDADFDTGMSGAKEAAGKVVSGPDAFSQLNECDVVFRSPGVHPSKLESVKGGQITSVIRYFFENCPGKIIGVTGTKGKGTTATLIYEMLKEDGRDVYLGGNIGKPPLEFLDDVKEDSWVVLELSSFQLMDMEQSPHVAVVLMTTSEHLDYHKDRDEYWSAKERIVKFQKEDDICIVNADYDFAEKILEVAGGKKLMVSRSKELKEGTHIEGPVMLYCTPSTCEMLGQTAKVVLPGPHNLENILAAATCARAVGIPIPAIQKVIYSFEGLPHRLEFVREIDGVKYYNDSFSTTPETCVAAAYAFDSGTVLICGGSEKNSDYSEWAFELQKNPNVKRVCVMGATGQRMADELKKAGEKVKKEGTFREFPIDVAMCSNLESALEAAREQAQKGDYVILSPAAASFDMFENYKERGEKFRELVKGL